MRVISLRLGPLLCRGYPHVRLTGRNLGWGYVSGHVSLSSSAGKEENSENVPELKQTLKKFYMRVHPDLYDSYEEARKLNSESLGVLTGITDSLAVSKPSTLPKETRHVSFYVKREYTEKTIPIPTEGKEDSNLSKIGVTIEGDVGHPQRFYHSVHRSLSSLFLQTGLNPEFVWGDDYSPGTGEEAGEAYEARTYEFKEGTLKGYLERMHRVAMIRMERARELSRRLHLVSVLLRGNGFNTLFDPQDPSLQSEASQYECLSNLRRMFGIHPPEEESSEDFGIHYYARRKKSLQERNHEEDQDEWRELRGRVFIFTVRGHRQDVRVDALGRIVLPISLKPTEWAEIIQKKNLGKEAKRVFEQSKAVQERQRSIASELGIDHLFSDPTLHTHTDLSEFLDRLERDSNTIKRFFSENPDKRKVPIRIHPKSQRPKFHLNKDMGLLSLSVECSPSNLVDILRSRGEEANHLHNKYLTENECYEEIRIRAKKHLKLATLQKGEDVNDIQFQDCCQRLIWVQMSHKHVFEGLSLTVSSDYEVKNTGEVRIKWNWID
ncbi:hypothetical protein AAMO2058_000360700 [Amorphochlora amoebiformis]